ncbi:MAG: response regulator, partial [Akkermansiaceae bacterium]|nr:response regulator [Akkermansiaceae bacterium]
MNREPLRLLLAEDGEADAILILKALENHGYCVECERVMTAAAFETALSSGEFDMILCDYVMPCFGALEAIGILQRNNLDIPLIIVSGTIGESAAVEAMRGGACDYLLKGDLSRLGAAVERELRDADIRRQTHCPDECARSNEVRYLEQRNALIALTRETQLVNLSLEE